MTKDETLKLALEALELSHPRFGIGTAIYIKAMNAIKEALAQQDSKDKEQAKTDSFVRQLDEALAQPWEKFCDSHCVWTDHHPDCKLAERLPLTDEEIKMMIPKGDEWKYGVGFSEAISFARVIEAALKAKNT